MHHIVKNLGMREILNFKPNLEVVYKYFSLVFYELNIYRNSNNFAPSNKLEDWPVEVFLDPQINSM